MIAALYVETNGVYYGLPGVDPWNETRDARLYSGPYPVVAHPPCAHWSLMGLCRGYYDGQGRVMYLGSPRFVVRELVGFPQVLTGGSASEGLTVTVIDRAYCGAVMRMWRSEERGGRISAWMKRAELRSDAAAFCDTLNSN